MLTMGSLILTTGAIEETYGSGRFDRLDGLQRREPLAAAIMAGGMLSLVGFPVFGSAGQGWYCPICGDRGRADGMGRHLHHYCELASRAAVHDGDVKGVLGSPDGHVPADWGRGVHPGG